MLKYAIRNALHYRAKYSIAFVLIASFAFCLALSLFAFNGFWEQAGIYARSWGDITIWIDSGKLDSEAPASGWPRGEAPTERLDRALPAFFEGELKATKVIGSSYLRGDAYGRSGRWSLTASSLPKARLLAEIAIAEGKEPGEGEVLVSAGLRKSTAIGEAVTFVYKDRDLILNSLAFRVSGFFLPTGSTSDYMFMSQGQFDALDEGMKDNVFFVFLPGMGGQRLFMTASEYRLAFNAFQDFARKASGRSWAVNCGYETAEQRHRSSKQLIEFFELIMLIFLSALVVVALATIVNVLFITLIDRIKIVGTFMAFGMRRGRAVLLLSSEMLVFALAACTVGILAALAAAGPVSSLKFTADNWTIAVILGGKRSLTIRPALWAAGATYLAGTLIPFAAAAFSASRIIKGEVVRLLHYSK